ncbi:unnamed protein product, partial [Ectocarpus fasciculatus]
QVGGIAKDLGRCSVWTGCSRQPTTLRESETSFRGEMPTASSFSKGTGGRADTRGDTRGGINSEDNGDGGWGIVTALAESEVVSASLCSAER